MNKTPSRRFVFLLCTALVALLLPYVQEYLTLRHIMASEEIFRLYQSRSFLEAIFPWSVAVLLNTVLVVSCWKPRRFTAIALLLSSATYAVLVVFFTGPLVVIGPFNTLAVIVWSYVGISCLRRARVQTQSSG